MKRIFMILLVMSLLFSLCACGEAPAEEIVPAETVITPQPMAQAVAADAASGGSIAVFAPDAPACWTALADLYTRRSGISVGQTTSAEAADLLCVDYATLSSLEASALPLGDSAAYALLNNPAYAYKNAEGIVLGLPLSLEAVAVAVNTELLEKAGYTMEGLDGFKALHRFSVSVDDRKADLGFSSWAPAALAEGSGQKLTRYLFDLPVYAEILESGCFTGKYVDHQLLHRPDFYYRTLFTTMLDFGTKKGRDANTVTDEEALTVFAKGEALFCLVDSRELETLSSLGMNLSKLDFVPAWMGIPDEADRGFVADATTYAVVTTTDAQQQHNAEDFLYWCLCDVEAQTVLTETYDSLPYRGFSSRNPLLRKNAENDSKGLTAVPWLHRQLADPEAWDSYFLSQLHYITPDNATWRWQVMISELVKRWNGQ